MKQETIGILVFLITGMALLCYTAYACEPVECVETVNPAGKNVPPAGSTTLPGPKGGNNEDGFYELRGDEPICVKDMGSGTVFGPFTTGTKIKYTEANGAFPSQKKIGGPNSAIDWHITGTGDPAVYYSTSSSCSNPSGLVYCWVPPPPK